MIISHIKVNGGTNTESILSPGLITVL